MKLMIIVFTLAYMIKGGILDPFAKWMPSGKLISTVLIALSYGFLTGSVTEALLVAIAWLLAVAPALGTYVQAIEGRDPRTWNKDGSLRVGVEEIDTILMPLLKRDMIKAWGWCGLALRGLVTALPFVLLLGSFAPLIMITMPVWYWLSWKTHQLTGVSTSKFWFAELYFGIVVGVGFYLGG